MTYFACFFFSRLNLLPRPHRRQGVEIFSTGWSGYKLELIVRPIVCSWGHFQKKVKEGLLHKISRRVVCAPALRCHTSFCMCKISKSGQKIFFGLSAGENLVGHIHSNNFPMVTCPENSLSRWHLDSPRGACLGEFEKKVQKRQKEAL